MHIAFVAISGVRASNTALMEVGLTLPGFVERSQVIASLPSLALLTLAGMTPETFDVSYHEVPDIHALTELPPCDVAAISSYTAQIRDGYELADRFRAAGAKVVMGGIHVTALPDEALEHADAVVIGEGEIGWPELLRDLEAGHLRRVYAPEGREFDLADSPMPRFDLLDIERYNRLTVQTQRGCPWRCEFCASSIRLTTHYKVKPVERVIAEIREIKRIWPHPFIEFADDNSFVNRGHSKELLRALAPERIHWFSECDISIADDPELLDLMREAGCRELLIGLESPSAAGVDGIEQRRNWKRTRLDAYRDDIGRIQARGIAVNGCFVLGLDGDGPEVFDAIEAFVRESGQFDVQITVMTPFPGTPLYERLRREGRLLEDGAWDRCSLFDVNFEPMNMTAAELQAGLLGLARRIYTQEERDARRDRFWQQRRRERRQLAGVSA
ncbi:MAG: hypothetical protein QG587_1599 [Chloroflexota bacterium]|nr:hypothetical protein [Chloroflexota bacterium]